MGVRDRLQRHSVAAVPPDRLARYAGTYPWAPDFLLTVSVDHGKLMVQVTGQPVLRVYPVSDTEFVYRVVEARIRCDPRTAARPAS